METEFTLSQLYPLREDGIVLDDMVGEFRHILVSLLSCRRILVMGIEPMYLMQHTVDERSDVVDKRYLCPLLEVEALVVLFMKCAHGFPFHDFLILFIELFHIRLIVALPLGKGQKEVIERIILRPLPPHVGEEEHQSHCRRHQHEDSNNHHVELADRSLQLFGSRLKITVLACLFLFVEIEVAVGVALLLVVESSIDHTQLLTDGSHEVGGLLDGRICGERIVQAVERLLILPYLPITLCKGAVCACHLVDITILLENMERTQGEITCQETVGQVLYIDFTNGRETLENP